MNPIRLRGGKRHATPLMLWAVFAVCINAGCQGDPDQSPAGLEQRVSTSPTGSKVVLFVIDGPRMSETFDDPIHEHIPNLWNQLRPLGTFVEDYRNSQLTYTMPGHATLLTGSWQTIANDGSERPTRPTLFEYFREETGAPQTDVVIVGGKQKLSALAYSTDPSYGSAYGAKVDVGFSADTDTYDHLIASLQTDQPRFIMVSFSRVDTRAHGGDWEAYLNQLSIVDSLAALTWNFLQSDPFYQNQTTMFITADHGRHTDANGGFRNHGDACEGCQRLPFLALGPDIRQNYVVELPDGYSQRDLCRTVGHILGLFTPDADGVIMYELFGPTATGIADP